MDTPTLDLQGLKPNEVAHVVARFIEIWSERSLFIDIIAGHNEQTRLETARVLNRHGLGFHMGYPSHQGKIRVVLYDDYH